MKLGEHLAAIQLRKKGLSYRDIEKRTKVSRSTLSMWLRDVALSARHREKLLASKEKGRYKGSQTQREKRIRITELLTQAGKNDFTLRYQDPLFFAGLFLYWAEGDKHKLENVKFTNSDPLMIALMLRWFREVCHVPKEKMRIALHIHDLHMRKNIEKYWSKITGIPLSQFHKTYVKKSSLRVRKNILYNGTCAIIVSDRNLFRTIMGWKLGMLQFFHLSP